MIWIVISIAVVFLLLTFILATTLIIKINTEENDYTFQWKGIVKASVVPDSEEIVFIRYSILFFDRKFYPLKAIS